MTKSAVSLFPITVTTRTCFNPQLRYLTILRSRVTANERDSLLLVYQLFSSDGESRGVNKDWTRYKHSFKTNLKLQIQSRYQHTASTKPLLKSDTKPSRANTYPNNSIGSTSKHRWGTPLRRSTRRKFAPTWQLKKQTN